MCRSETLYSLMFAMKKRHIRDGNDRVRTAIMESSVTGNLLNILCISLKVREAE